MAGNPLILEAGSIPQSRVFGNYALVADNPVFRELLRKVRIVGRQDCCRVANKADTDVASWARNGERYNSRLCAGEAGSVVGASAPFVLCDLGVGAERAGAVRLAGWSVCGGVKGENRAGSFIVFDPSGEGCVEIEYVGAVAAVAVPHAGSQIESHGGGCR